MICSVGAKIQPLSPELVHLIAAGEVIDSLAAVVRELAENALDAGAQRLSISLWPQQWRIQVADDGTGMTATNLVQAATPHSTSKIRTSDDLRQVHSLGFRGEALHSLAQLSDLVICSRGQGSVEPGWRCCYGPDGQPLETVPVAIATGTIVTADQLFGRWPSRRQVLPSLPQQLRAVQLMIQQLALCHPQVTWQVTQSDRPWFTLWPGETPQTLLPQLLRQVMVNDLQQLTLTATDLGLPDSQLALLVGLPDRCHRPRPDWVRVAVNGRAVQVPLLTQTIIQAFRRTLPRDRYPVCFLHLTVPASQVDWNRTPAKSEIYLQGMEAWCDLIPPAIDQALRLRSESLSDSSQTQRITRLVKAAEQPGQYNSPVQPVSTTPIVSPPWALKAIAQVHNTYILAEHPDGLCLIEQHIAHERVLYEELKAHWQLAPIEPPLILRQLSEQQCQKLQQLGLDIDLFGEDLWAIRSLPVALKDRPDCADAILELSLGGDLESALVATACRIAIRNGTPLALSALQTLLDSWQQTAHPNTCPHGRPICLSLKESSLAKYFRRHWVIGKSHGI